MSDKYATKAQEFMRAWADDEITDTQLEGMLARALRESAAEAFEEAAKESSFSWCYCLERAGECQGCRFAVWLRARAADLRRPA